jgi:hypothetical protein
MSTTALVIVLVGVVVALMPTNLVLVQCLISGAVFISEGSYSLVLLAPRLFRSVVLVSAPRCPPQRVRWIRCRVGRARQVRRQSSVGGIFVSSGRVAPDPSPAVSRVALVRTDTSGARRTPSPRSGIRTARATSLAPSRDASRARPALLEEPAAEEVIS